jgi:hypothetical protein
MTRGSRALRFPRSVLSISRLEQLEPAFRFLWPRFHSLRAQRDLRKDSAHDYAADIPA